MILEDRNDDRNDHSRFIGCLRIEFFTKSHDIDTSAAPKRDRLVALALLCQQESEALSDQLLF